MFQLAVAIRFSKFSTISRNRFRRFYRPSVKRVRNGFLQVLSNEIRGMHKMVIFSLSVGFFEFEFVRFSIASWFFSNLKNLKGWLEGLLMTTNFFLSFPSLVEKLEFFSNLFVNFVNLKRGIGFLGKWIDRLWSMIFIFANLEKIRIFFGFSLFVIVLPSLKIKKKRIYFFRGLDRSFMIQRRILSIFHRFFDY